MRNASRQKQDGSKECTPPSAQWIPQSERQRNREYTYGLHGDLMKGGGKYENRFSSKLKRHYAENARPDEIQSLEKRSDQSKNDFESKTNPTSNDSPIALRMRIYHKGPRRRTFGDIGICRQSSDQSERVAK
ncbi:hypothetical protein B0H11DRAFT_1911982 [Mycena galericulata]|nr:hypothetical protein B0H11DRAFT_1911982 [Mycena galericulata]